jgi:hypothetical protein
VLEQLQEKYVRSLLGVSLMDTRVAKRSVLAGGLSKSLFSASQQSVFYKWALSFLATVDETAAV